ncbi:GNAT family N-acetyltransferase [Limimaricola pyoseonensis]|uniref:Acetyltransferase (GNAT) family protein n=1 Tax=Limimaricola pyoseonensis TaxID=521013 RepID=A0A1G7F2E2_9RHOB|nr:GNAT family N-acetyltransferase [Limimaricola pyoseonensis]SDE70160.1 Acetyltransferase (GNAT) family protein [Limimaricola pyoseonensis]
MTPARGFAALAATWPPAASRRCGPVRLRDGAGGGSRVSAATVEDAFDDADLDAAISEMGNEGRAPLFMVRSGEDALDAALAARGFAVKDPTLILAAPLDALASTTPDAHWPPDETDRAIWADGGIGPERITVMQRTPHPRAVLRGPDACAFVVCHDEVAMLHALEVAAPARRRGAGRTVMAMAAGWARTQGAAHLALAVTRANAPARALYARLGYAELARYHYRVAA